MSDYSPARQELAEFAQRIRSALQASRADRCNALHHDLEVGEALIEAQDHVTTGWKSWLGENCPLSVRTGMLYMQLARHRAEIEAEIERVGELSLRAAVRLVTKKKLPEPESTEPPKPAAVVIAISKATDAGLSGERVPLSGAARGRFGGDISVPALGRDLRGEAKCRGNGFNRLYDWLGGNDFLVIRADRKPLLIVATLELAAQVVRMAEHASGNTP